MSCRSSSGRCARSRHPAEGHPQVLIIAPADRVNPVAVSAMAEESIDITAGQPKLLTDSAVRQADVVITMGCGDTCPVYPGKRYEDWDLDDPAGRDIEAVRPIRDEIRARVQRLIDELIP